MPALGSGVMAPDFTLPTIEGKQVSLSEALKKGPVLLAFFKVSCPVCQYAFPYFERIFQANRGTNVTVLGVSQDNAKNTQAFTRAIRRYVSGGGGGCFGWLCNLERLWLD